MRAAALDNPADTCPRCAASFHCGVNDAGPCACTTLTLTPELQAQLQQRFSGCLCLACLRELAQNPQALDAPPSAR
jgi:Cysteine-rich CWC